MKKSHKKLIIGKETIRVLDADRLDGVGGGWIRPPITWSCPQPAASSHCPQEPV